MSVQLIEILKSSENHNKWEDVSLCLRSALKESGDKMNNINKSLMIINGYINNCDRQLNLSRDKTTEYIKIICRQKSLSFSETMINGHSCLELSAECFRIVIVMQDVRMMQLSSKSDLIKQVMIEYNKEKPTSCPELQKSISEGDYSLLVVHIEELLQLYSVGNDRNQQLKAFLCLQSLEEDINKLAQCPILLKSPIDNELLLPSPVNIIGVLKPRSGGIPSQFTFYVTKNGTDNERFNAMVQLMPHDENNLLPFIPLVNLQKDSKGNCVPSFVAADSLKCVSLAAKFVLKLSKPLVLSVTNILTIYSITGLHIFSVGERKNYINLICEQAGSPLTYQDSFYSILPNDKFLVFRMINESFDAETVTFIPFLLPSHLPKIVAVLKKQASVNVMMESFLLTNAVDDYERDCSCVKPINISFLSHDEFVCSFLTSNDNESKIKFSISYNDFGQSIVKLLSVKKYDNQLVENPQKVVQKYNNLPMVIFWILFKSGDNTAKESLNIISNHNELFKESEPSQNEKDRLFLNECLESCRLNVTIKSSQDKDVYPKIKIEPALELISTTYQQPLVNSPAVSSYHDIQLPCVPPKITATIPHPYEQGCAPLHHPDHHQGSSFQNQYLHQQNNINGLSNQVNSFNPSNMTLSTNQISCGPSSQQNQPPTKSDQYPLYAGQGAKHMSLDQMLSSDFAMPFTSEGIGPFNAIPHSLHYPEHSNSAPMLSNTYGSHVGNLKESLNTKSARQLDTQSSVLVNLLNSNENSVSSSSSLMSRQGSSTLNPPCFPPSSYTSDQLDTSKNIQSQMIRGPQIPRMRMSHPNQQPKPMIGANYTGNTNIPSVPPPPMNRQTHPPKSDLMMMPYPQDTGSVRGASIRKPRKRRTPNLEMNQRLPKMQTSQFPLIQQPTPAEAMYMSNMPMSHPPQTPMINQNPSSASASFSSSTTMDQSVYDFDDNVECSRIRTVSSNSSISPHSMNPNNATALNRRVSGSGSKKPLKVKISRKVIEQNASIDSSLESQMSTSYDQEMKMKEKAMCRSNTMPNISSILSAPSSTSSTNTIIGITTTASSTNHGRPTAIMSAIDSPLTCSSISSLQASPYGSIHIPSQHNIPGTLEACGDGTEIKKRRKRRLKLDPGDDADNIKREKLEMRKQNRKKKELSSVASCMSSHSSMENLSNLINDSNLKPPSLPIKLSVNAKMGSVSNNLSSGISNKSKIPASTSCPSLNAGNGPWSNPNPSLLKQSLKDLNAGVEPILKNYKIPKKKANDIQEGPPQIANTSKVSHSDHVSKSFKEFPDVLKSEISSFPDRPKSPMLSHHDGSMNSNMLTQSASMNSESNFKSGIDNQTNPACPKGKNLNDVVNRLKARTSCATPINSDSTITSNPTSPTDSSRLKVPDYNQNSSENIFEKFSNSKSIPKNDLRQFPPNRFQDPSMNVHRYPYNRPPGVYPTRTPVQPPSFNYNIRQPYLGNQSVYRMESPVPRNFTPIPNNLQYHKKNGNNGSFPRKKP